MEISIQSDNKEVYSSVVIDKNDLTCDLAVECVVVELDVTHKTPQFIEAFEFNLVKTEGSLLYFETNKPLNDPGSHQYGLRVFPKNPDLPHRMDFAYMKWI